jgi:hypothetical protein
MSSSSSINDVEDQVVNALSCAVDHAFIVLRAGMKGSPIRQLRLHRHYVNRDHEVPHERLHPDYFAGDCLSDNILSAKVTYSKETFSYTSCKS